MIVGISFRKTIENKHIKEWNVPINLNMYNI
jgi:hypothetical protein